MLPGSSRFRRRFAACRSHLFPLWLVLAATALFLAVALLGRDGPPARASQATGGMDAMSVDMDPVATPANTATAIGSTEPCARIDKNGVIDADEDTTDALSVDITATNIPASTAMVAFAYTVLYNEVNLSITAADHAHLLAANSGSSTFNAGQPTPDTDGNGNWSAAAADVGSGTPESGSGILSRLTVAADAGAVAGVYALSLSGAGHVDAGNGTYGPDVTNDGSIAVNRACPGAIQQADLEVTGVTVTSPASAIAGTSFTVSGAATLHNNGPFEPVNADAAYSLHLPAGCTALEATAGSIQDVSLALSASVAVPAGGLAWTVTCNTPGSQRITLDVSVAPDAVAVVDPVLGNNATTGIADTNITATSDLTVTAVTINAPSTMTVGTASYITARATMHNQGPFGPTNSRVTLTLTLAPGCVAMASQLAQTATGISLPVSSSVDSPQTATMGNWFVRCEELGPATFTVDASVAVDQLNVAENNAANNSGSAQATMNILLPACGNDPNPAGFPVSDPHPEFLTLLSQLASMAPGAQQPTPPELRTPASCNLALTLSDNKGAPIDDCEVSTVAAPKPCSIAIDASIDQVGGSPPNTPSARLLPVAVSFLPPTLDLANDTGVANGSLNGSGSFQIRTDGGLGVNGIGCVIDAVFPITPALEGGILPNVADSDLNAALKDPMVWPNDLNGERAAVESALTLSPAPLVPAVTLWSRSVVNMNIPGLSELTLNVLTWRIDDPVLASITGAKWVTVAFPGDAVNPDPAGPSGGNPDFDESAGLRLATCAPFGVHLEFAGMAGGVVARQCLSAADPMVFALLDPDAVNYTGDDGPRSDTSPCSVDADMDGLTANEETYYGSDPLDSDTDDDTMTDGMDNCRTVTNPDQTNFDGDAEGDACDPDVDGDGATNATDLCVWTTPGQLADANGCSQAQVDADADGACNPGAPSSGPAPGCTGTDNCPQDANPNQADFDSDHMGDTCDRDDDNDGVTDGDESNCGGDPYDAGKKPERLDLPGDENGDGSTTDGLPPGAQQFDCDGDGYTGSIESHVFSVARDQDACGTDAWPSDFVSAGIPNSTNRITVTDLTSFLAPIRRLDTSPGDPGFSVRWDLVPGMGVFARDIAVNDLTSLIAGSSGNPPMLNGVRAFSGPSCPWPP